MSRRLVRQRGAVVGPRWFRTASWLLDYPFRGSFVGFGVVFVYLFGNAATIAQLGGLTGSVMVLVLVIVICATIVATLAVVLHALRWALVYGAIKSAIRGQLWGACITKDTVLVGGSSGGGIAVGMVAKAIQELYGAAPRVAVIDQDYLIDQFNPATSTLVLFREELRKEHVLYVTSYVGTGRSRHAMLTAH
jgi:hypothetical protein